MLRLLCLSESDRKSVSAGRLPQNLTELPGLLLDGKIQPRYALFMNISRAVLLLFTGFECCLEADGKSSYLSRTPHFSDAILIAVLGHLDGAGISARESATQKTLLSYPTFPHSKRFAS